MNKCCLVLSLSCVVLCFAVVAGGACPEKQRKEIWCDAAAPPYCGFCDLAYCGGANGCAGPVLYSDFFDCQASAGKQTSCEQVTVGVPVVQPDGSIEIIPQPKTAGCYRLFQCTQRVLIIDNVENIHCVADLARPTGMLPKNWSRWYESL